MPRPGTTAHRRPDRRVELYAADCRSRQPQLCLHHRLVRTSPLLLAFAWFATAMIVLAGLNLLGVGRGWRSPYAVLGVWPAVLIYVLYHPVLELVMHGRTPGKRTAGVRLVTRTGGVPGAAAILTRNIFRLLDSMPFLYLVGLSTCMISAQRLRIGDMAAGTVLVLEAPGSSAQELARLPTGWRKPAWTLAVLDAAQWCWRVGHHCPCRTARHWRALCWHALIRRYRPPRWLRYATPNCTSGCAHCCRRPHERAALVHGQCLDQITRQAVARMVRGAAHAAAATAHRPGAEVHRGLPRTGQRSGHGTPPAAAAARPPRRSSLYMPPRTPPSIAHQRQTLARAGGCCFAVRIPAAMGALAPTLLWIAMLFVLATGAAGFWLITQYPDLVGLVASGTP